MAKTSPFAFVEAVSFSKTDMVDDIEHYVPYLTNKALSYHVDGLFYANDLNQRDTMDLDQQFTYLLHSLKRRKRFSKWAKPEASGPVVEAIQHAFCCNARAAREIWTLLDDDQLHAIVARHDTGGRSP